ncbi:hypothetical protein ACET3Z_018017 [Daucus carota]
MMCAQFNAFVVNGPMFAQVVPAKHRTMIYAFDRAFEGSFSSFAAAIVGILAEQLILFNRIYLEGAYTTFNLFRSIVDNNLNSDFLEDGSH